MRGDRAVAGDREFAAVHLLVKRPVVVACVAGVHVLGDNQILLVADAHVLRVLDVLAGQIHPRGIREDQAFITRHFVGDLVAEALRGVGVMDRAQQYRVPGRISLVIPDAN
ncbi:hypothetical protein D3C74_386260 [compost metagenome]